MKYSVYILTALLYLIPNQISGQTAVLVRDLTTGAASTNPKSIVIYKNKIYFLVRNPTTNIQQIFNSDLTSAGTGLVARFSNSQIIGNLAVTDSVFPNGNTLDRHNLFFVSKRIGPEGEVYDLKEFDGTTEGVLRNLNLSLSDTETSPITDIELTTTSQEFSNQEQNHINPITKHADSSIYYSNIGLESNFDTLRWSQSIDYDNLTVQAIVFPNSRTWFFIKKDDVLKDDVVRGRDDNAQGTMTPESIAPGDLVGIASGYMPNDGVVDNRESRFMFFSKLPTERRLKAVIYAFNGLNNSIPTEQYHIIESAPLSIEITKRGIYHQDSMYYTTAQGGLWISNLNKMSSRNIQPDIFVANSVNNLTLVNGRAFFTAATLPTAPVGTGFKAPFGGLYELVNTSIRRRDSFPQTGRQHERVMNIGKFTIAVSKDGTNYTFKRMDGLQVITLGTAPNVDMAAGIGLVNGNTLVFSANNGATGQELYKMSFVAPRCTLKPDIFCPANITVSTTSTTASVTIPTAFVVDDCNFAGRLDSTYLLQSASGTFNMRLGDTTIMYTATNAFGTSQCSTKITVVSSNCATDVIPPVIKICPPSNTILSYNNGNTYPNFDGKVMTSLQVFDNCTQFPTITRTFSPALINDELKSGISYTVTVTARDARNNVSLPCTFKVKYVNLACEVAPIFQNCPDDITVNVANGVARAQVDTNSFWRTPRLNDQCDPTARITLTHPKNTFFPLGKTRVTYSSLNSRGQSAKCSFTVSVISTGCSTNTTPPSVTNCPSTPIIAFTKTDSAIATWHAPTFADGSCGGVVVDSTHKSGSKFKVGTTLVTYSATNSRGLTRTCSFNVTVNRCVTSVNNRSQAICQGNFVQIGTKQYRTTGNYRDTLTSSNGCDSIINLNLTVNPLPIADISGSTSFCAGGSTTLTASGGTNYAWSNGATTPSITVRQAGTYTVTVTNATGCNGSTSIGVTLKQRPIANITPNGPTNICSDKFVRLTASGGVSYFWSTAETTPTISVNRTGSYFVTVTNTEGCQGVASQSVNVSPKPIAKFAANIVGGSVTLTNQTTNGSYYLWQFGVGRDSSLETNPVYKYVANGTYCIRLIAFSADGCQDTTVQCLTITRVATQDLPQSYHIEVSPNPFNDLLTIKMALSPNLTVKNTDFMTICDVLGKAIKRVKLKNSLISINSSDWLQGVYLVSITIDKRQYLVTKLVKMSK